MERDSLSRRDAMKVMASAAGAFSLGGRVFAQAADPAGGTITINPAPQYALSPYLFMQFMEPLGATDSSVEAAWDHRENRWRRDVVEATAELGPTMLRWGGIFCDYYRWKEAVGPRAGRRPMANLLWGGVESNQVGTVEFTDFCRQVGADPLICVNFESDGRRNFMEFQGDVRTAGASEAAEWVAYCNDPDNPLRREHGINVPPRVPFWQLGNETSYDRNGFDLETAARKTVEFARAMRKADPSIQLIAWGDSGWAGRMLEVAGEHVQMLAFHHMFDPDRRSEPVLRGETWRRDPATTWDVLMEAWKENDRKIRGARESLRGRVFPLAMTECHFAIPGRDRCDVMSAWATGVAYARMFNNFQRHGDLLKIATAADFCGNRWQVNAVMIPTPAHEGRAYLMPVARVMQLYRRHIGEQAVAAKAAADGLDVTASRTGKTVFVHVVNTNRTRPVRAQLTVEGETVAGGRVFEIADEPMAEVSHLNSGSVMETREMTLEIDGMWTFPAASVSAVELRLA